MSANSNFVANNGGPSDFNKHLMETERAFKLMSIKNNSLDSQIEKLKKELEEKDNEHHEAYKTLLSIEEETEAEKTILLSLKKTVRTEANRGEELKRQIEAGHALLISLQKKERNVIEKFEEDSALVIEKVLENHKISSTHELTSRVYNMKQKLQETQEKRQLLQQNVEELQNELSQARSNTGYEGLDQVYAGLLSPPKDELDEEKHYMSTLQTLMRLYNKKKRHLQTIFDA